MPIAHGMDIPLAYKHNKVFINIPNVRLRCFVFDYN